MSRTRITTMSTSAALRTFKMGPINIPLPTEGQVVHWDLKSEFPYQVMQVNRMIGGPTANGCNLLFTNDDAEITFDDSQSPGVGIPCTEPTVVTSEPTTGDDIVNEDQQLSMLVQDVESDVIDLTVELVCRRLDEDVAIT